MIAAILRAQLLSMRVGASRGAVLSVITGAIWYGFWVFLSSLAAVFTARADAATLHRYLPIGFLAVCFYWQVIPILSASMGSALDMRKLLVYPAPHGRLFLVEVLLRLVNGVEITMVLVAGAAGLSLNRAAGGWGALARLAAPVLLFILFNVLLASGMRSVLERLLSRRKVRELLAFLMVMLWMAPRLVVASGIRPKWLAGAPAAIGMLGWPWSSAARAALGESAPLTLLSLGLWTVVAAWFGRTQFERNLRYDALAAQATPRTTGRARTQSLLERFYRFPGLLWRDPLAAIVEKEIRSLARTPRFRMVFVMAFTFGLMVWLPMILGRRSGPSAVSRHFLVIVCVYALTLLGQVSYWNCFGFDRSAAIVWFAARVMRGKDERDARLFVQLFHDLHHLLAVLGIQVGGRFVGQHQGGVHRQGAGHSHALLLPSAQLIGAVISVVAKAHRLQHFFHTGAALGRLDAVQQQGHLHVLVGGEGGDEGKELKDESDGAFAHIGPLVAVETGNVLPIDKDGARRGLVEQADELQQGGLAGARRADQGGEFAVLYDQVHAAQCVGFHLSDLEIARGIDYFCYFHSKLLDSEGL